MIIYTLMMIRELLKVIIRVMNHNIDNDRSKWMIELGISQKKVGFLQIEVIHHLPLRHRLIVFSW